MKKTHILVLSFAVSLLVWMLFTWPLPRYVAEGIPMSHSGGRDVPVRYMEAGDHLQLLYYFWLFSDMVTGNTPWMYNPYEFHTGDEEARYMPGPYYVPFSGMYTVLAFFSSRAFAYNMAGFVSIWLTYLFSWLLVRRYVRSDWIAAAAATISILLPYRWFCLLGGSPTGFAMALPPMLLWGLDRAVRDESVAGGFWAAAAILFSIASDLHTFFFNVLLTPAWCLIAFIARWRMDWRSWAAYRRLIVALLPAVVALLVVLGYSRIVATDLSGTHMAEGRAVREVMTFSPQRDGFLGWEEHHVSSQIYVGYTLLIMLVAGGITFVLGMIRKRPRPWRCALLYMALAAGALFIALLALGPHGPRGAWVYQRARLWIPTYDMIRQTGKIYSIFPTILAVLIGLSLTEIRALIRRPVIMRAVVLLPILLMGAEYGRRMHPPICLLTNQQPAYAAVADHAAEREIQPHIFVVPLWPGDSHYASAYQYYVSLYRLRMVNGYTPAISQEYFNEIFLPFQTINQGWFSDAQADDLLQRGIAYLILHEDMFPEKVSPFPVTYTLKHFLTHPRLELLQQDGPIWAFHIRAEPGAIGDAPANWNSWFPARVYEMTRGIHHTDPRFVEDPHADRGGAVRMSEPDQRITLTATGCPPAEHLRWMIRARGTGTLHTGTYDADTGSPLSTHVFTIDQDDWTWFEHPFELNEYRNIYLEVTRQDGVVDVDITLLTAGVWEMPEPGQTMAWPAPLFFHAGHIDLADQAVHFSPEREEARILFYGPRMPIPPGEYEVALHFSSPAPRGTPLGRLHLHVGSQETPTVLPVVAGEEARVSHKHDSNLPFMVVFVYMRQADMAIHHVEVSTVAYPDQFVPPSR